MKNRLILSNKEIIELLGSNGKGLSEIFDDKFGIVNAILERNEFRKYGLYMYQCLSANASTLFDLKTEISSGGLGINSDRKYAMIGCLAEALERYCMSYIPKEELISSRLKDLENDRVFNNFFIYSNDQYKTMKQFLNPKKDKIEWTKIYSVDKKNHWMYWPASLIYMPYEINKCVGETTTTGMAAGATISDCIESGLLELIERDALMINFMQRLNPPEIKINSVTGINKKFIEKIKSDYNIKIYKLYTDIEVPVILSIVWTGKGKRTHYGIGASASIDSDVAIYKALKESLFTYFYTKNIIDTRVIEANKIKSLHEHCLYYQKSMFDKLLFKSEQINYVRETTSLNNLIKNMKKLGIDIYYKEVTTSDIKKTGIKVAKVIAPGLIDMHKSHVYPRLNANRYWDVPRKLGLKYNQCLSDMPHPFP